MTDTQYAIALVIGGAALALVLALLNLRIEAAVLGRKDVCRRRSGPRSEETAEG